MTDRRDLLFKDIIKALKIQGPAFMELSKAALKYQAQLKQVQKEAAGFYDALMLVANLAAESKSGAEDLALGIREIAQGFRTVEEGRDKVARSLLEDFILPLNANADTTKNNAMRLEKDYGNNHKKLLGEMKKAELASAKAGKMGPQALQMAMADVTNRVKEMEAMIQAKLREAIIEDRRRYCFLIMHFAPVIREEINLAHAVETCYQNPLGNWTNLAVSPDVLPERAEALVTTQQQRTFVPIQPDASSAAVDNRPYSTMYDWNSENQGGGGAPQGGYYNGYDNSGYGNTGYDNSGYGNSGYDNSGYGNSGYDDQQTSDYNSGVNTPGASTTVADGPLAPGDQAIVLYDYSGDEISVKKDDVIEIKEVNDQGWSLGELHGQVGWIPSTYIQKHVTSLSRQNSAGIRYNGGGGYW